MIFFYIYKITKKREKNVNVCHIYGNILKIYL